MIGITPLHEVTPIRINIFLTPYSLTIENHKTSIYIVYLCIYLNSQFHIFNNNISGDNLKNVKKKDRYSPVLRYLITWDGNVVLLRQHISGIFLGNVQLHALINPLKYSPFHTWYLLSNLLMCEGSLLTLYFSSAPIDKNRKHWIKLISKGWFI